MLLFDAHLPAWAAGQIQADFPGATHARLLAMELADDERIWLVFLQNPQRDILVLW